MPGRNFLKAAAVVLTVLGAGIIGYTGLAGASEALVQMPLALGPLVLSATMNYVLGAACAVLGITLLVSVENT